MNQETLEFAANLNLVLNVLGLGSAFLALGLCFNLQGKYHRMTARLRQMERKRKDR